MFICFCRYCNRKFESPRGSARAVCNKHEIKCEKKSAVDCVDAPHDGVNIDRREDDTGVSPQASSVTNEKRGSIPVGANPTLPTNYNKNLAREVKALGTVSHAQNPPMMAGPIKKLNPSASGKLSLAQRDIPFDSEGDSTQGVVEDAGRIPITRQPSVMVEVANGLDATKDKEGSTPSPPANCEYCKIEFKYRGKFKRLEEHKKNCKKAESAKVVAIKIYDINPATKIAASSNSRSARIKDTGSGHKKIKDTSQALPRIEPDKIAVLLGAEETDWRALEKICNHKVIIDGPNFCPKCYSNLVDKKNYPILWRSVEEGLLSLRAEREKWKKHFNLMKEGKTIAADKIFRDILGIKGPPMDEETKEKLRIYAETHKEEIKQRRLNKTFERKKERAIMRARKGK